MQQPQPDTHALSERPPVSVMVPVYNVERHLPQCVESILAQDYDRLDIVLFDDGSTDGCPSFSSWRQNVAATVARCHTRRSQ